MTLSRIRPHRQRREQDEDRRKAEDEEYQEVYDQAWALTDRADDIALRLSLAAFSGTPEQFEQVRKEAAEFLESDALAGNGYAYLGHLQMELALRGLDIYSAERPYAT